MFLKVWKFLTAWKCSYKVESFWTELHRFLLLTSLFAVFHCSFMLFVVCDPCLCVHWTDWLTLSSDDWAVTIGWEIQEALKIKTWPFYLNNSNSAQNILTLDIHTLWVRSSLDLSDVPNGMYSRAYKSVPKIHFRCRRQQRDLLKQSNQQQESMQ